MTDFLINHHYNFTVHAAPVLGASFRNARLVSVLDYQTALKFGNVVLLHRQVYPYLPSGTSEQLTRYTYYLFKVGDRDVVLADVWIIASSVELSQGSEFTLTLRNVSSLQLSLVQEQLKLLGIVHTLHA
jgi:hypothetical protein